MMKRLFCIILCIQLALITATGCAQNDAKHTVGDVERQIEKIDGTGSTIVGTDSESEQFGDAASLTDDSKVSQTSDADDDFDVDESSNSEDSDESDKQDLEANTTLDDGELQESAKNSDSLTVYTDEQLASAAAGNSGLYAYATLSDTDKRLCNQMYLGLMEMTEGVSVNSKNQDTLSRVFQCVMMDHPEIFWATGYTFTKYSYGDEVKAVGFQGTYSMNDAIRASRQIAIDQYVNNCLAGMPAGDDYQKIKYVYEYVILHTEYDVNSSDNQNICSVCISGRSVCQGYAKTVQLILNKAGIMCTLVSGVARDSAGNNQSHVWNLVRSNGAYYYVDATWGDASYSAVDGYEGNIPQINYDFLCINYNTLSKTHSLGTPVAMPSCTSLQDNYYVREGMYFTGVDDAGFRAVFDRAYAEGRDFVVIKASDASAYSQIKGYLLDNQKVFDYLHEGSGTVSYWENTDYTWIRFNL